MFTKWKTHLQVDEEVGACGITHIKGHLALSLPAQTAYCACALSAGARMIAYRYMQMRRTRENSFMSRRFTIFRAVGNSKTVSNSSKKWSQEKRFIGLRRICTNEYLFKFSLYFKWDCACLSIIESNKHYWTDLSEILHKVGWYSQN